MPLVPIEDHMDPVDFARKFHFGYTGATRHRSCMNCAHCGYTREHSFHCQHPFVRLRCRTEVTGAVTCLDTPLSLAADNRDTVCDEFAEMMTEEQSRSPAVRFDPMRFRGVAR